MPEKIRGRGGGAGERRGGRGRGRSSSLGECSGRARRSPGAAVRTRSATIRRDVATRPSPRHERRAAARRRARRGDRRPRGRPRAARPAGRARGRPTARRSSWSAVAVRDPDRAVAAGAARRTSLSDAPAHLVADDEIDVIVELMGGDEPAHTLIAAALSMGKRGRHRQQARHRPPRPGARGDRPADRRRAAVRGRGRRRDPGPRAARDGPRRQPHRRASAASSTARPTTS